MSLTAIFQSGSSGLQAAQTGLRTVADNISNVDTPGYIRKIVDQAPRVGAQGGGVDILAIRLAADRFLQAAGLQSTSLAGSAKAQASLWDQAQSLFGDPTSDSGFFSSLDKTLAAFSTVAANPTSIAARGAAVDQLGQFFDDANSVATELDTLKQQVDQRISDNVARANTLLAQIDKLNADISRNNVAGGDPTALQNQQSIMIDELAGLVDVKVQARAGGGVNLSTSEGVMLVGDGGHASYEYNTSGSTGEMFMIGPVGQRLSIGQPTSGEIAGLIVMRNTELPNLSATLAELVSGAASQLNAIHNAFSVVPPPQALEGRQTGLDSATAVTGFTGKSTVDILDSAGNVLRKVDIDFSAGTVFDGTTTTAFTPATFVSTLNTALTGVGQATYTNGVLKIEATVAGAGVAVADDATTPATKGGKGFSTFFGLNDLVRSSQPYDYNTGLTGTSPNGFNAGGTTTFRISDSTGARIKDIAVSIPTGDMNTMIAALNDTTTGVGIYGSFALDSRGQLAFTPVNGNRLSVTGDTTQRTVGGATLSSFFGISQDARTGRASSFEVRSDIAADPSKLSLAKLDLSALAGGKALSTGDVRGADALSRAGLDQVNFEAAGGLGAVRQSLSDYAAALSGLTARKAAAAEDAQTRADAQAAEAAARRSQVEGVNLDQELVNLTTYQQAYNASARLIQAAKDMYDVLLQMV